MLDEYRPGPVDFTEERKEEKRTTSHHCRVTSRGIPEASRQAAVKKASWARVTVIFYLTGNGPLSATTQCGFSPEVHFPKRDQIPTRMGEIASVCATLWTVSCQLLCRMGFTRREHWSGLPCPTPGDLPDSGIEHRVTYLFCNGRQVLYH